MSAYQLVMRHRADGHELWHQDTVDGHAMSYGEARAALLATQRMLPGLHEPRQGYYLLAAPIRGAS